jgi:hypothetical protein
VEASASLLTRAKYREEGDTVNPICVWTAETSRAEEKKGIKKRPYVCRAKGVLDASSDMMRVRNASKADRVRKRRDKGREGENVRKVWRGGRGKERTREEEREREEAVGRTYRRRRV